MYGSHCHHQHRNTQGGECTIHTLHMCNFVITWPAINQICTWSHTCNVHTSILSGSIKETWVRIIALLELSCQVTIVMLQLHACKILIKCNFARTQHWQNVSLQKYNTYKIYVCKNASSQDTTLKKCVMEWPFWATIIMTIRKQRDLIDIVAHIMW